MKMILALYTADCGRQRPSTASAAFTQHAAFVISVTIASVLLFVAGEGVIPGCSSEVSGCRLQTTKRNSFASFAAREELLQRARRWRVDWCSCTGYGTGVVLAAYHPVEAVDSPRKPQT